MDARYHNLRRATELQGLSDTERTAALDLMEAPAHMAANMRLLLRGTVAERGHLLDPTAAAARLGQAAGRVLLAGLLASHSQCQNQPYAPLTAAEWQRGQVAASAATCCRLLDMYLRTRRTIAQRQYLALKTA
jgi:hypothetical protein